MYPFDGPIRLDPGIAALRAEARARDVPCICERSPWCRGALSADWGDLLDLLPGLPAFPWHAPIRTPAATGETNT